jgi:hypothetical protein
MKMLACLIGSEAKATYRPGVANTFGPTQSNYHAADLKVVRLASWHFGTLLACVA